jgi:metal-dependent hydrolase (beta-lactamase superfamily II)
MGTHTTISITVLSDNRAAYGLEAEHGLSLLDRDGRAII